MSDINLQSFSSFSYYLANYYSMKGYHDKSIMSLKRSLRLNSKHKDAWTIIGHEYLEMKNTGAAIESYRRALGENINCFKIFISNFKLIFTFQCFIRVKNMNFAAIPC